MPPVGETLQQAFQALVTTLNERGLRYAIIGGLATIQHTRPRTTDDIDVLLTVPQIAMPGLFKALAHRGFSHGHPRPELPVRPSAGSRSLRRAMRA